MSENTQVTDIAIVGGGMVGLSVARALTQRGRHVTVIEGAQIGERSAANVAAGMLAPAAEVDLTDPLLTTLAVASHHEYGAWVADLQRDSGVDVGYEEQGTLIVAMHQDHLARLEALYAVQVERGLPTARITTAEARQYEPFLSPNIIGALRTPDGQVNPRLLLRALPIALERAGATLFPGTRVLDVSRTGDRYTITVERDGATSTVQAQQVLIAAGAWSKQIVATIEGVPALPLPMRPVRGQILRLRGERLIQHVVRSPDVYLVPRADGELVVGATMEEMGFETKPTAGGVRHLLTEAWSTLPGTAELEVAELGVGFRPALRDHNPAIGNVDGRGLFVASGHFRNGVELAPVTGRIVANLMCGSLDATDAAMIAPFAPDRFGIAEPAR